MLGVTPDVFVDGMPRMEFLGVVNQNLPEFLKIGIDKRLARGCSMNHLHKRFAGSEIYYLTNTTGGVYRGRVLLKGTLAPEAWDPHTGEVRQLSCEPVLFRGTVYTSVDLTLDPSSSVFLVSPTDGVQAPAGEVPEFFPKAIF
jgi:hypothetical protein